jgi:hypothetical protein
MFDGLYDENGQIPFIRDLCAGLDEEAIQRAEWKYIRYLELTWQIYEEAGYDFGPGDDSPDQ